MYSVSVPSRAVEGRGSDDAATTCFGRVQTPRDGEVLVAIPLPKRCGLYLPGHEVRWIQLGQTKRETAGAVSDPRGSIQRDDCHRSRPTGVELWTHHPRRLRAIVNTHGHDAPYHEGWRLLRVPFKTEKAGCRTNWCIDVTLAANPGRHGWPPVANHYTTLFERIRETGASRCRGGSTPLARRVRKRR